MRYSLDHLIERWANTTAYKTSIEEALNKKLKLVYLVPGMNLIKAKNNGL